MAWCQLKGIEGVFWWVFCCRLFVCLFLAELVPNLGKWSFRSVFVLFIKPKILCTCILYWDKLYSAVACIASYFFLLALLLFTITKQVLQCQSLNRWTSIWESLHLLTGQTNTVIMTAKCPKHRPWAWRKASFFKLRIVTGELQSSLVWCTSFVRFVGTCGSYCLPVHLLALLLVEICGTCLAQFLGPSGARCLGGQFSDPLTWQAPVIASPDPSPDCKVGSW